MWVRWRRYGCSVLHLRGCEVIGHPRGVGYLHHVGRWYRRCESGLVWRANCPTPGRVCEVVGAGRAPVIYISLGMRPLSFHSYNSPPRLRSWLSTGDATPWIALQPQSPMQCLATAFIRLLSADHRGRPLQPTSPKPSVILKRHTAKGVWKNKVLFDTVKTTGHSTHLVCFQPID